LAEQQVEPLRRDPAIEFSPPAPIQIGECGRCTVGGSTTMLSNCQYLPRWENGSSAVHALRMTTSASSNRASASSIRTRKAAKLVVVIAGMDAATQAYEDLSCQPEPVGSGARSHSSTRAA
jgi:hypothetical protein